MGDSEGTRDGKPDGVTVGIGDGCRVGMVGIIVGSTVGRYVCFDDILYLQFNEDEGNDPKMNKFTVSPIK